MPNIGFYVSDLHMFSQRSQEQRYLPAISAAVTRGKLLVLGGDIFDFRWTTLAGIEETVEQGVAWLTGLIEQNRGCHIHYVLGNHDHNELLMERLDELAGCYESFLWRRYYLRLGDKLFLHGDVADWTMDHAALIERRARWEADQKRQAASHLLYDLAIRARLHKLPAYVWHRPERVVRRVASYIESIGHGRDEELRHVYFGHTHRAFSNYPCGKLLFHNCGAPIPGLPFKVLQFQL